MNREKVIEVLEGILNDKESGCGCSSGVVSEALTQAISLIKENEQLTEEVKKGMKAWLRAEDLEKKNAELRKENKLLYDYRMILKRKEQELTELKAKCEDLEKELEEQKKYCPVEDKCHKWREDNRKLQQELADLKKELNCGNVAQECSNKDRPCYQHLLGRYEDLKKAVASEGLGVEEIAKVIEKVLDTPIPTEEYLKEDFSDVDRIAEAIVEAQTKYKKGER